MQFDRGYLSPYFITNAEKMVAELEDPFILLHEKKLSNLQALLPVLEAVVQSAQAAPHHRRRRRGRGACHAGGQQAPWRPQGRGGQGAGLRRSPQGDARRHRRAHRRSGDLGRPRHQARERHARHARPRQEGVDLQGEHHHRRRRRQEEGHRGAHQPDQGADRGDHLGLRQGEAAGAAGEARRRRRGDPRRRRDRDRGQGEEGPRRRCPQRHPRGGRGRHCSRRRRRAAPRQDGARQAHVENPDVQAGINIVLRALEAPIRQIVENAGVEGSIVVGKVLESKVRTTASMPRPRNMWT